MNFKADRFVFVAVSAAFFVSGSLGVVYEVIWSRYLALVIGARAPSQVLVLATFMAGLAAGYYYIGRRADSAARPLRFYALLEIFIGAWGLLLPLLYRAAQAVYPALAADAGPARMWAVRLVITACVVLPPTVAMGATLPLMIRGFTSAAAQLARRTGLFYGLNCFGGAAGSLLGGFVIVRYLGLSTGVIVTGAANIALGVAVLLIARRGERTAGAEERPAGQRAELWPLPASVVKAAVAAAAISGAAAMVQEVAWIRLLALIMGASTYSFSLMLGAFIAGLGIGSILFNFTQRRRMRPALVLSGALTFQALIMLVILPLFERLPWYFLLMRDLFERTYEEHPWFLALESLCCLLLMLPVTVPSGMALPAASAIYTRALDRVGARVGSVFALNTLGTVAGALLAGFVLMPAWGLAATFATAVALLLAAALPLLVNSRVAKWDDWWGYLNRVAWLSALVFFMLWGHSGIGWDPAVLASGEFRHSGELKEDSFKDYLDSLGSAELEYYKDGESASIAVFRLGKDLWLKVNGKTDASTFGDLPTQLLLGHLPMIAHGDARRALVIGFGSGITSGAVLTHPKVTLDLVEISAEVLEGSRAFGEFNHHVQDDPRFNAHVEDATTYLKTTDERFDVIISEPSNPWMAGVGNLYTREYFEAAYEHLGEGGLMMQWFHLYEMSDRLARMVLRTYLSVFDSVTVWVAGRSDVLLLGAKGAYEPDFEAMAAAFTEPTVRQDLDRIELTGLPSLLYLQVMSDTGARVWAGGGELNTNDHPLLEYEAPAAFFTGDYAWSLENSDERALPGAGFELWLADYEKRYGRLPAAQLRAIVDQGRIHEYFDENLTRTLIDRWEADHGVSGLTLELRDEWIRESGADDNPFFRRPATDASSWHEYTDGLVDAFYASHSYYQRGQAEGALWALESLIEIEPENPDNLLSYGKIQLELGRSDKAAKALARAIDLGLARGPFFTREPALLLLTMAAKSSERALERAAQRLREVDGLEFPETEYQALAAFASRAAD